MIRTFFISILVLLACFFPRHADASFGMSPAKIHTPHILPGQTYETNITLTRSETAGSVSLNTSILFEHDDWVTINNNLPIYFEDLSNTVTLPVKVAVPETASIGIYSAKISFQKDEFVETSTNALALLGATLPLRIFVTDEEEKKLRFVDAQIKTDDDSLIGRHRITIDAHIENIGNVVYQPTRMAVSLYHERGALVEQHTIDQFMPIAPFASRVTPHAFSTNIPSGNYRVEIQIFDDYLPITEQKISRSLSVSWKKQSALLPIVGWILLGIVVVGSGYAIHIHRLRRSKEEMDAYREIL